MENYRVTGMSCAACSAHVEKAVRKVPGVTNVAVNLLTHSMKVEGTAEPGDICKAVSDAGYGAAPAGKESSVSLVSEDMLKDTETPEIIRRLAASVVFLLMLMYVSMGHMMWGWPLPGFLEDNHVGMGIVQMILAGIVMVINQKYFINGFKGALHGGPNMDTLVAMGSGVSFAWSVYVLLAMSAAQTHGNMDDVIGYMNQLYFESAAMILALITIGKTLESYSKGRTTDALKGLMELAPKTAILVRNDVEEEIPVDQVQIGDIFIVRPGTSVPVDGIVTEGSSAVDESVLTGESIPVDKEEGDSVSAATMNHSGYLRCRAARVGNDTTLSQIISMVSDTAATKAPIARKADQISGIFVPAVLVVALITLLVWILAGQTLGFALARAISVLVISCPCALGLATPVAIMVGSGLGARNGILFKTAESLETAGEIQIAALDKTGTITTGKPSVTDIIPVDGVDANTLMETAAALESRSEHPLAGAIMDYAEAYRIPVQKVSEFQALTGSGVKAKLGASTLMGGSLKFISTMADIPADMRKKADQLSDQGKTPLFFLQNNVIQGIIAVADTIKEDSRQAIEELKGMGIYVVMLTGDNRRTADAVGAEAGVDEVIAGVLPGGKKQVIRKLQKMGRVAMVGDGINDAPALTRADTGIAIGAGTDVAVDAADVVLMNNRLSDVPAALRLSRATLRNIKENLGWAFIYNIICIPVAAGVFIKFNGWTMNPMLGALAMSLSSVCVVSNALRLNFFDLHRTVYYRNNKKHRHVSEKMLLEEEPSQMEESGYLFCEMEEKKMTRTVKINGMMCTNCEAHVKKALEALSEIDQVTPNHENNEAVLELNAEISDEMIKKAVEDAGYEFVR